MANYLKELEIGATHIIHEADDDEGNPTLWAVYCGYTYRSLDNDDDVVGHWINVVKYDEQDYRVESVNAYDINEGRFYKTSSGAIRKAREIAKRRNESGCFDD